MNILGTIIGVVLAILVCFPFVALVFEFHATIKAYEQSERAKAIHELRQSISEEDFIQLMRD